LAVHVQDRTLMDIITTNLQNHTGKGMLMVGNWKETNKTYFVEDPKELQQGVYEQLQVPGGSILYKLVTVNIHYLRSNTWSQEVIEDLKSYSAVEDKQGGLQVIHTWNDAVQEGITVLTEPDDLGMWN
jgi:hypothetical protein